MIFIDCETTGLDPSRHEIWEVAGYNTDTTEWFRYQLQTQRLAEADPVALQIGRFYERRWPSSHLWHPGRVAEQLASLTSGQVLAGIGPWFDAAMLERLLRSQGLAPAWDHRLFSVKDFVVGVMAQSFSGPPFSTSKVAEAYGINTEGMDDRHTAVGDVLLALRMYQAALTEVGKIFDFTEPGR